MRWPPATVSTRTSLLTRTSCRADTTKLPFGRTWVTVPASRRVTVSERFAEPVDIALLVLVVESEFTLVGVNPQLDQFKELAAQMRSEAEQLARAHGRSLSPKLAA